MRQLQRKDQRLEALVGSALRAARLGTTPSRQLGEGGMGWCMEGIRESIERRCSHQILHHELARVGKSWSPGFSMKPAPAHQSQPPRYRRSPITVGS